MPNTEFSVLGFAIMGIVAVATAIYTYYNEPTAHRPNEHGGRGRWNDDGNDRPAGGRGRWNDGGNDRPDAGLGDGWHQGNRGSSGNYERRTDRRNTFDGEYSGSRAYGVSERNIETGRSRGNENPRNRQYSPTTSVETLSLGDCDNRTNWDRKSEDICAICQESLTDRNITTSHCGHKFHYHCLYEWNTTGKNNCPVCRSPTC